jgi:hypothetical protein
MIAMSCVYMSAQYCGIIGIEGKTWLDILSGGRCYMDLLMLISISIQILQVISDKRCPNKIIFNTIADDLEKLRLYYINTRYNHSLQKHCKVKRDNKGNNVIEINQKDCKHRRL